MGAYLGKQGEGGRGVGGLTLPPATGMANKQKKRLRQDTYQQQGLSNLGVVVFTKKKAPAASWIGATGLAKIIPPVAKPNHPSWVG